MKEENQMFSFDETKSINPNYIRIASDFLKECQNLHIPMPIVTHLYDGFRFSFCNKDGKEIGDGIIHSGSYYNHSEIETMGMPWDNGDVSTHTPYVLARLIYLFYSEDDA